MQNLFYNSNPVYISYIFLFISTQAHNDKIIITIIIKMIIKNIIILFSITLPNLGLGGTYVMFWPLFKQTCVNLVQ